MFPASTNGGGQAMAFPNVCKVPAAPSPPIPTPFPTVAQLSQADGGTCSDRVRIVGKKTVTVQTEIPRSSGDEAGTLKGVISNTNMDKVVFRQGSSKVTAEGNAVVTATRPTAHNGSNANAPSGLVTAPSQSAVILMG